MSDVGAGPRSCTRGNDSSSEHTDSESDLEPTVQRSRPESAESNGSGEEDILFDVDILQ